MHDKFRRYLWWDDTAADDEDVWPVQFAQFLDELRDQSLVSCSQRADPNAVDVSIHCLLGDLHRRLFITVHRFTK